MAKSAAHAEGNRLPGVPPAIRKALLIWAQKHLKGTPTHSRPVAVALSGGADSMALLLAVRAAWPGGVIALHVNHGLQAAAKGFSDFCAAACQKSQVPLRLLAVDVSQAPGVSVEAEARQARYAALASAAEACGAMAVLLGQHADDQAETVFLALTRGAGMPGLAAMGECSLKHGALFGRPFLRLRAVALKQWLISAGVPFVEDPSNQDQRFTRNRIRLGVMPVVTRHFPAMVDTLTRTARHAGEAAELLKELARSDLQAVGTPPRLDGLRELSLRRQANVLRYWLQEVAGWPPSTAQLDELLSQIENCCTRGHGIAIKVSAGWVHRRGPVLDYVSEKGSSLVHN